jgi:hypothetical protein
MKKEEKNLKMEKTTIFYVSVVLNISMIVWQFNVTI